MNQILYTGKTKKKGPASIKSIVRFFSVSLIILGIIFLGEGSYALYTNYTIISSQPEAKAQFSFEQEANNAVVSISHTVGISIVKYHWNDEEDIIKQGGSRNNVILDTIDIPSGINTLYVSVTDDNNKIYSDSYEFTYDGISIDFSVINNTDIKISASDVSGLSYITYRWNSEEPVTAYPNGDDNTIIEQTITIPSGLNTLSITAVNSSNHTLTKEQQIKGVYPPKLEVFLDGYELNVIVTDDEGIKKITQQLNDNTEEVIYEGNGEELEHSYKYMLDDSPTIVTITVTDAENVTQVYRGKNYDF